MSQAYVGVDRRRNLKIDIAPAVDRRLRVLGTVAIIGWCLLSAALVRYWPQANGQLFEDARGCAAVLFLTAGVLRLAHWRVDGEAPAALAGGAFIVLGSAQAMLTFFSPVLNSAGRLAASPIITVAMLTPTFLMLLGARRLPAVRADLRPVRWAVVASAAGAVAILVLVLTPLDRVSWLRTAPAWLLAEGGAAGLWALLAVQAWRRGRANGRRTTQWTAAALALLALGRLLRAVTALVPGSLLLVAVGLSAISAGILLLAVVVELCASYAEQGSRAFLMSGGLAAATERLRLVQDEQSERLHDARSAILGALGASQLLSEPARAGGQERLHQLMVAELFRLSCSLDPEQSDPVEVFAVSEIVDPLLLAHQVAGGRAAVSGQRVHIRARRNATATVLANLLENVRRHAPGATATVSAQAIGGRVCLVVEDDGPGVEAAELDRLGRRGQRGSQAGAPGSGLGLFNSRKTVAGLGGTLEMGHSRFGGLRVELWLPAEQRADSIPLQAS